jgi:hypothetical protein
MRLTRLLIGGIVAAVIAAIAVALLWPIVQQDKCLDSGGAWRNDVCVH